MDKVKFGRALGYGARHAVRAVAQAVDAAATPSAKANVAAAPRAARPAPSVDRVKQAQTTVRQVSKAAGGIGRSVGAPVVKFSRVLFLQVAGTFFTLIAVVTGSWLWKQRAELRLGWHDAAAQKLYLVAAVFVLFTYFALSSFLRARRLERR